LTGSVTQPLYNDSQILESRFTASPKREFSMNGNDDLLEDILPMVIYGILDPRYITGKDVPEEDSEEVEEKESSEENNGC